MRYLSVLALLMTFSLALSTSDAGAMTYDQLTDKMKAKGEVYKNRVKDMTMIQTMTLSEDGQTMTHHMTSYTKGDKSRTESEMEMPGMGKMKSVSINDGKDEWVYSDMTDSWQKMSGEEKESVGPGDWWVESGKKGKVVGEESVGGRAAWKVIFKDSQGDETVWIDKKEYFPLKSVSRIDGRESEARYSDFRDSGMGFLWPHVIDMYEGGTKKGNLVTKSIKTNTGLKDSLFTVPKEAASKKPDYKQMIKKFGGMLSGE